MFKTKRVGLFSVVILLAAVGAYVYKKQIVQPLPTPVAQPKLSVPEPVKNETHAAPAPQVTNGYVIAVTALSRSINGEKIGLSITNDGDIPLTLEPDTQFTFVGVKTQSVHLPLAGKTTPSFAGNLQPNDVRKGDIVFDAFTEEDGELRFYPQGKTKEYVIVPLITLPQP